MTHINDRMRRDQWRVTKSKSRKPDLSPEASTNTDLHTEGPVHIWPAMCSSFQTVLSAPRSPRSSYTFISLCVSL